MPGILAIVSDGDVHASIAERARALCVEPWMTTACDEVVPGVVTIGRVSNGSLDARGPLLARNGQRIVAVDGTVVAPDDLWIEAGLDRRDGHRTEDLVLALASRAPAATWAGRLNGTFVILLWDGEARSLSVVTDRSGFRPHYVAGDGKNLVIGPSIRFVLGLPWVSADLHPGSVMEQFAFQCVLEDRTFFEDIEVLPPFSVTTISMDSRQLRTERTWGFDRVPVRDEIEFGEAVEEALSLCRRAIRRHTAGEHRYGIWLSGGMDSRILLAGMAADGRAPPTFTYGLTDCRDIARARSLSRICGVENRAFPFTSGHWIREVAQRHVDLTDGVTGLFHSHGVHMGRDVREHADVILCGLGGGIALGGHKLLPVLRSGRLDWRSVIDANNAYERKINGIGFVDPDDLRALFTDAFRRDPRIREPREALETALEPLRDCPLRLIPQFASILHRERKQLAQMLVQARSCHEDVLPFLDHDLLDFGLSLPPGHRRAGRLQKAVLDRLAPRMAAVPMARNDRLPTRRLGPRLRWKTGRKLAGVARALSGGRVGRPQGKYSVVYDEWIRHDLFEWAQTVLLDRRTLGRDLFDPAFVRRLFESPIHYGRAWTWQVGMMLSFELMLRHLVDRPSD